MSFDEFGRHPGEERPIGIGQLTCDLTQTTLQRLKLNSVGVELQVILNN